MPSEASATRSRRGAELLGLSAFALALMLLISLATFNPGDPSPFFKAGEGVAARNFIGPFGAFLAELLVPQLFGVAALLLPMVLGIAGWKLFWCRPIEAPYTKAFGLSALLLSLTALLTLTSGTVLIDTEPVRAGGATGELLEALLVATFNRTGAYIVVATTLFVSLILSTQFSFAAFLKGGAALVGARVQAVRTAWAHWRETRRKEKMRREVIRKHALAQEESQPRVRGSFPLDADEPEEAGIEEPEAVSAKAAPRQKALVFATPPALDEDVAETEAPRAPKTAKKRVRGGGSGGSFPLPASSILDERKPDIGIEKAALFERAKLLQSKSAEFGVLGVVKEINPGPVVTTYEFKPDAGIKYSKIVGLADDLALALQAESIRIDRMSGRGTVGIEIPNQHRETQIGREQV